MNECICICAFEFVSNFSNCAASNGVGWGGVDYKLCMATALKCSALAAPVISARRHNVSRKSYLCLVSCHRGGRDTHHHLLHHTARAVPPPSNEFLSSLA